jgi:DNA-binding transcriptional ArsR family regulator
MEARRDVFQAISDPTRRKIIGMVVQESCNMNALASHFNMTRQAISLHVKILTECGLIVIHRQGRDHFCEAKLDKLSDVADWIEQYWQFYERKPDSPESYIDKLQKKHGKKRK